MTDLRDRYGAPAAPSAREQRRRIILTAVLCAVGVTAVSAAEMVTLSGAPSWSPTW